MYKNLMYYWCIDFIAFTGMLELASGPVIVRSLQPRQREERKGRRGHNHPMATAGKFSSARNTCPISWPWAVTKAKVRGVLFSFLVLLSNNISVQFFFCMSVDI